MESPFNNGASWADQWDDNPDPFIAEPKKGRSRGGVGKKVGKGLGKTKAVASSGVKKVKAGTCIGFGWIKGKCHKTPQTLL